MPDDRFFHKRLGYSAKVNALTPTEEIVWRTYVQSADDFGVLPFTAAEIQRGHDRFLKNSGSKVLAWFRKVCNVGLLFTFVHQNRTYVYQRDWQDFQKVRYPDHTLYPRIPDPELRQCTPATQWLHTVWPGTARERKLTNWKPPDKWDGYIRPMEPFHESDGTVPSTSCHARGRADARERAERAKRAERDEDSDFVPARARSLDPDESLFVPAERAARFVARYAELFREHRRGARYFSRPDVDLQEAERLIASWDDARLETLAIAFLLSPDPYCRDGSGSIKHFASRASWCDAKLRESGL